MLAVDWGDGTSSQTLVAAGALSASHAYVRDGAYTVIATVTDARGVSVSQTFVATIANATPTIGSISPSSGTSYGYGATVPVSVSFSDRGTADTHSCAINWGDGTWSTGTVSESNGSGTCAGSHPYPTPSKTYTITVTVFDDSDASATKTTSIKTTNKPAVVAYAASSISSGTAATKIGPKQSTKQASAKKKAVKKKAVKKKKQHGKKPSSRGSGTLKAR